MTGWYDSSKRFLVNVTEAFLLLVAVAVVAGVLFGSDTLPFVGGVAANLTSLIKQLGDAGLVGLIATGIIIWLISRCIGNESAPDDDEAGTGS